MTSIEGFQKWQKRHELFLAADDHHFEASGDHFEPRIPSLPFTFEGLVLRDSNELPALDVEKKYLRLLYEIFQSTFMVYKAEIETGMAAHLELVSGTDLRRKGGRDSSRDKIEKGMLAAARRLVDIRREIANIASAEMDTVWSAIFERLSTIARRCKEFLESVNRIVQNASLERDQEKERARAKWDGNVTKAIAFATALAAIAGLFLPVKPTEPQEPPVQSSAQERQSIAPPEHRADPVQSTNAKPGSSQTSPPKEPDRSPSKDESANKTKSNGNRAGVF